MGDITTHAIFYGAYWHLCVEDAGFWRNTKDDAFVCKVGDEDSCVDLKLAGTLL